MAARRMWILLLLAAVFSMHSIASSSADPGAVQGAAATADHGMGSASSGSQTLKTSGSSELASSESWADSTVAVGEPVPPNVPAHDVSTHFVSVCLAVLLAGFGWLISRVRAPTVPTPVMRFAAPRPRLDMGWFRPPRPPDLAALCLLRI